MKLFIVIIGIFTLFGVTQCQFGLLGSLFGSLGSFGGGGGYACKFHTYNLQSNVFFNQIINLLQR